MGLPCTSRPERLGDFEVAAPRGEDGGRPRFLGFSGSSCSESSSEADSARTVAAAAAGGGGSGGGAAVDSVSA